MKEFSDKKTGELFFIQPGQKLPFISFPESPDWENPEPDGIVHDWKFVREFARPCGQCVGCRSRKVLDKANRCEHEARYHDENAFITLTVDDQHMADVFPGESLCYRPFKLFNKRFRKKINRVIRFMMCAEYGEKFNRPHYHAIIFGWFPSPEKRTFYKQTSKGPLYFSHEIEDTWEFGENTVAYYDFACGAYVASYIQKKLNGKLLGLYKGKTPEFCRQSNGGGRRKGIAKKDRLRGLGSQFYDEYKKHMYSRDFLVRKGGGKNPIPAYYDKLHMEYHPTNMQGWKNRRTILTPEQIAESTPVRLAVREAVHKKKLATHIRPLERGNR